MKKLLLIAITCSIGCVFVNAKTDKKKKNVSIAQMVETKNDSLVYALGQSVSANLNGYLKSEGILQNNPSDNKNIAKMNDACMAEFKKGLELAIDSLSPLQKAYVLGASVGQNFHKMIPQFEKDVLGEGGVDKDLLFAAICEGLEGKAPLIPNAQALIEKQVEDRQQINEQRAKTEAEAIKTKKLAEETKFFANNSKQDGVVSLPNGLQYKVLKEGTGVKPSIDSRVKVHYEGRLLDGTVFDSSIQRGEPATFPLSGVIKGWTEILQEMPVGSKWTVYIPQELAYGSSDMGAIPPFSTLEFDIELLSIE